MKTKIKLIPKALIIVMAALASAILVYRQSPIDYIAFNSHVNDLLITNLPAPQPSGKVVSISIKESDAPSFFTDRPLEKLASVISRVMARKPLFAVAAFQLPKDGIDSSSAKEFLAFTRKFPNLYFYLNWQNPGPDGIEIHPILKDLNLWDIPLTRDQKVPPRDERLRRLIVDFNVTDTSTETLLLDTLNKYGFRVSAKDFKAIRYYESLQTHIRYRKADTYSSLTLSDFEQNAGDVTDKIVVFSPDDNWNRDWTISLFQEDVITSGEHIAMAMDTLILKDALDHFSPNERAVATAVLVMIYLAGLLFLGPVGATQWGAVVLFFWFISSLIGFAFFNRLTDVLEVAIGIGVLHFIVAPALLNRYLRAQDRREAERIKEFEVQKVKSSLVVKSAQADMGLKIAAQVAHDIRSPLSAISIVCQRLERSNQSEATDLLRKSVERLNRIASDLLRQYRTGEIANTGNTALDVRGLLSELLEAYRQSWMNVTFELTGESVAIVPAADHAVIERAFSNLINNAIEATSHISTPKITISLGGEAGQVVIQIFDNGPGIPAEARESLFQRGATFGKVGGSGLGLAQVKEAFEAIGGKIELLDRSPGAHFRIQLPKHESEGMRLQTAPQVIIVEDNPKIREHWRQRLVNAGAHVTVFASPEEFEHHPDIGSPTVITDLIFEGSGKSGLNVLELCQERGWQAILCSSLGGSLEIQQAAQQSGAKAITKAQFEIIKWEVQNN